MTLEGCLEAGASVCATCQESGVHEKPPSNQMFFLLRCINVTYPSCHPTILSCVAVAFPVVIPMIVGTKTHIDGVRS